MNIFIAILALSFLIIVHEFGHFIVAKLSGIKVHEFALFMGPKLFSVQRGETTYSIRSIPLGGYVKMEGEEEASEDSRAFNKKPIPVRAAVIAAGPIMNLITALIIIIFITFFTGYHTTKISVIDTTSAAAEARLQQGDEITKFDKKTVYNMIDLQLFMAFTKGKSVEVEYIRNGETRYTTLTPEIIPKNRYIIGFSPKKGYGEDSNIVQTVNEESPAYAAGLRPGDRIIRMGNTPINNNREIREFMKTNGGNPVDVGVLRDGKEEKLSITPIMDKNEEQYNIGILFADEQGGLAQNIKHSFIYAYSNARNVYYSFVGLATGRFSLRQTSGPVGIVVAIGDVVQQSPSLFAIILNLLSVTAFISINLGLFNLIPFPALDGSKLLLLGIEGIRKKAIPPEKEAYISLVGFVLLIMLMIFATSNDILRLLGKG